MTLRMRSSVIWASLALPFQMRQCSRSTSATIAVFAAMRPGASVDNPLAASLACCSRMAMWNQSAIGCFVTPASARIDCRPAQPSVNAVTVLLAVRPTASRLRRIRTAMSVSDRATAPNTCRPPSAVSTLPTRTSSCRSPSVAEVERLHWRIWNGKAKDAQITLDRIRKVMHVYKGERGHRSRGVASRKLWHALHEIDSYLRGQSARLVNYAERYRAGLRVGTSVTEGTANFLVNRRMNKSQQMRWSRRGADLLLQVRCAVYNGAFGSEYGQRFHPANDSFPPTAIAA